MKAGVEAAPHHRVRREASGRENDRGGLKLKRFAPGAAGENARDASVFGEERFGSGAVVNLDAETLRRGEECLHVIEARPNGTRRDVAHSRRRNRPEGFKIPAHAELYEPDDGVVTFLCEKPYEFWVGFGTACFERVPHEAFDVLVATSCFRIGKGDRNGSRRENGVTAQQRSLFKEHDSPRTILKGGNRGGKSRRPRAHDHDVGGEFPSVPRALLGVQSDRRRDTEEESGIKEASSLHRRTPIRMRGA